MWHVSCFTAAVQNYNWFLFWEFLVLIHNTILDNVLSFSGYKVWRDMMVSLHKANIGAAPCQGAGNGWMKIRRLGLLVTKAI